MPEPAISAGDDVFRGVHRAQGYKQPAGGCAESYSLSGNGIQAEHAQGMGDQQLTIHFFDPPGLSIALPHSSESIARKTKIAVALCDRRLIHPVRTGDEQPVAQDTGCVAGYVILRIRSYIFNGRIVGDETDAVVESGPEVAVTVLKNTYHVVVLQSFLSG